MKRIEIEHRYPWPAPYVDELSWWTRLSAEDIRIIREDGPGLQATIEQLLTPAIERARTEPLAPHAPSTSRVRGPRDGGYADA